MCCLRKWVEHIADFSTLYKLLDRIYFSAVEISMPLQFLGQFFETLLVGRTDSSLPLSVTRICKLLI